jgi:hypothetical protein
MLVAGRFSGLRKLDIRIKPLGWGMGCHFQLAVTTTRYTTVLWALWPAIGEVQLGTVKKIMLGLWGYYLLEYTLLEYTFTFSAL